MKPLVIFLVGPTASGKSQVSVELARKINAEIISCDSMQVYRGMDVLSGKLSKRQRKGIVHHLIDIQEPKKEYNVSMFQTQALKLIKKIYSRNKIALIVGGTGLYARALTRGLFADKGQDILLRKRLYKQAQQKGNDYLYKQLEKIDPKTAAGIHPHNLRRVIRAIEAYKVNKIRLSELKTKSKGLGQDYQVKIFGLRWPREQLYKRIEKRVDAMFINGIVKEVEKLSKLQLSQTAKQALGLKQVLSYLNKECILTQAKDKLKQDTRRFAKRQLTWFRQEKDVAWIDVEAKGYSPEGIASQICILLKSE